MEIDWLSDGLVVAGRERVTDWERRRPPDLSVRASPECTLIVR